jgi:effector-binding domain-containing protein
VAYDVQLKKVARQDAAVVRFKCPAGETPRHLGRAFGEIGAYLHETGVEHEAVRVYARFLSLGPEMEVEAGFTVPSPIAGRGRVEPGELPGGEVAMTTHVGAYSGLAAAADAVRASVAANGRQQAGDLWEVYVDDPDEVPEARLRTEVYIRLK